MFFGSSGRRKRRGWRLRGLFAKGGRDLLQPGGPPGNCICPRCANALPREPGIPCFQRRCPRCGSIMTRQFVGGE